MAYTLQLYFPQLRERQQILESGCETGEVRGTVVSAFKTTG